MATRIAVVGAYGSGKTHFTTALSRLTSLPRIHGSAPGSQPSPVHKWTPPELVRFTVQRFTERLASESSRAEGFVSDGSVLHEWIYAKARLVCGSYPRTDTPVDRRHRDVETRAFEAALDAVGELTLAHARASYDAVVHLPIEFELAADNRPVNENFRTISETLLLSALDALAIPVHVIAGPPRQRLDRAVSVLDLTAHLSVDEVLSPSGPTEGN